VRSLFSDLAHAGELEPAAPGEGSGARILKGEAGRESEGTRVRFTLRVAEGRVLDVRYRVYGCPHTLATCEWLARVLPSQSVAALLGGPQAAHQAAHQVAHRGTLGGPLEWVARLEVPDLKLGRLLVVEDALRNALSGLTIP
jgi:NifU-like protein involved in Fe-S cluster formation